MPCRIGLLAHEVAHLGGLPDLYDGHTGQGIGAWGLLGYSEGFGNTGHTPSHFSPWAKYKLKWLQPKDLSESGTHRIKNVENYPDVYRIRDGFPDGEYLLIENRQPIGFDRELPGGKGGLAIWHIDENKRHNREPGHPDVPGWPDNNAHYMVALVQADGRFDLEKGQNIGDAGDLFRGGPGGVNRISSQELNGLRPYRADPRVGQFLRRLSGISEPGKVMTFRYDVEPSLSSSSLAQVSSDGRVEGQSLATSGSVAELTIPIRGATIASAEFSHEDRKQLQNGGVLLEARVELDSECIVHVRGSASVASVVGSTFSTGVSDDDSSRPSMWKDSVRLASVSNAYSTFSVNCRRRMPAGSHVIRWVVRSKNTLRFPAGGSFVVQAYPCPPRVSAADSN
jgi:hypothetical protein